MLVSICFLGPQEAARLGVLPSRQSLCGTGGRQYFCLAEAQISDNRQSAIPRKPHTTVGHLAHYRRAPKTYDPCM